MKIPVYNCMIEDSVNDITGVYAISFVDLPANEVDFVALNKKTPVLLSKDSKKQILTGVVLKPEQLIYRFSEQLGEFYIKFSADQIEKIAQKMMKTGIALYNTTHQHESQLNGNFLTELWIVENPSNDKSTALGFKDLPKGTLMCSYKIEDKSYWDTQVMTGNVKGFSLEGFFNQELNLSKITNSKKVNMKKKFMKLNAFQRKVLQATLSKEQMSEIDKIEKEDGTGSGDTVRTFTLKDGSIVTVDEDGQATLDDEAMQAGEHPLADGNILVIDDSGKFVETKESSSKANDPEDAKAKETLAKQEKELAKLRKQIEKLEADKGEDKDSIISALKKMIEDQKTIIDELKAQLENSVAKVEEAEEKVEEQKTEIEELKKVKPTTTPATQRLSKIESSKLSFTDRIALGTLSQIERKK